MEILKTLLKLLWILLFISFLISYWFNLTIWKYIWFQIDMFIVLLSLLVLDFSVILKEVNDTVNEFNDF